MYPKFKNCLSGFLLFFGQLLSREKNDRTLKNSSATRVSGKNALKNWILY